MDAQMDEIGMRHGPHIGATPVAGQPVRPPGGAGESS
jgi:hypothetical protein